MTRHWLGLINRPACRPAGAARIPEGGPVVTRSRRVVTTLAAVIITAGTATVTTTVARAATTTLCNSQTAPVAGGSYTVQNNEWGSSAAECITTDGNPDFTVANSSISNSTSGAPGGYPSIYKGCHWGACTTGSGLPLQVSSLTPGTVTTSWSTTQPGTGAYDVAYDIWFNQTPTTSGQPNGAELMIWLNHNGPVQPFGSQVGTATVGGRSYNVWFGNQGWNTISYSMTSGTTSVSGLDIGQIAADAVSRGYIQNSWYLIDVEAGFELWQGGAGLAANSFSVNVNGNGGGGGGGGSPTPTPTPTPTGTAACSAAYSVTSSWPGGFQGQVKLTNTGSTTLNGWQLAWTFPGDQKITSLWNGTVSQSGEQVTVTNAAYDGSVPPGSSVTVGFTGTYSSSDAAPTSFTANGAACST
jgi:cellulase/cellobiase CelA1